MAEMIFGETKSLFIINMNVIRNGMALAVTADASLWRLFNKMAKMIFGETKSLFIISMNVIHNGMALAVTGDAPS